MQRTGRYVLAGFIAVLLLTVLTCTVRAETDDYGPMTEDVWVLCQPNSFVWIRERPSGRSPEAGYAECGDVFETDGRKKNGFLHVYASVETGEGWISLGYIVWEKPVRVFETRHIDSKGRVNARRTIGGKRRCWLKDGDEIKVYWMAEWAVTNKGFVKAEYIGTE